MAGAAGQQAATRPARRGASRDPGPAASVLPVARVAVDVPLAHLDRPFDYLVPERLVGRRPCPAAGSGSGSRASWSTATCWTRAAESEHQGRLAYLERVVSPEPVLTPGDRGPGPRGRRPLRRHPGRRAAAGHPAPARRAPRSAAAPPAAERRRSAGRRRPGPAPWAARTRPAPAFLDAAGRAARAPRAVLVRAARPALAGGDRAAAAATAAAAGRGALVVVPDARDLACSTPPSTARSGPGQHVMPVRRPRARRAVPALAGRRPRRGQRVVAGTRAAMFAPVRDLGLVVLWDDGDDLHAEPRAPYPHAREVLALRAHRTGAAALIGGFARTAEADQPGGQRLGAAASPPTGPMVRAVRPRGPAPRATTPNWPGTRRPGPPGCPAWRCAPPARPSTAARSWSRCPGAATLTALACERCRAPAPLRGLRRPAGRWPASARRRRCGWCGAADAALALPALRAPRPPRPGDRGRRAPRRNSAGPSPASRCVTSGGRPRDRRGARRARRWWSPRRAPSPGPDGGYAAAVLLDGWALLGRPSLRAAEEALRRWMNAAALVRAGPAGGRVVVVADAALPAVQALVRWDPVTHAERELAERAELRFPARGADGGADRAARTRSGRCSRTPSCRRGAERARTARSDEPVPGQQVRMLVRVPRSAGLTLASALHAAQAGADRAQGRGSRSGCSLTRPS